MENEELMPQKSFGLLKLIARERSKTKASRVVGISSSSLPSGLLDYVDLPPVEHDDVTTTKTKKTKPRGHACHPVVVIGLLTVILYIIFMTLLIGYFHVPRIKAVLDSLQRLANIREWLRIIFKPWHNSEGKERVAGGMSRINEDDEEPKVGPHLNPEFDVHVNR